MADQLQAVQAVLADAVANLQRAFSSALADATAASPQLLELARASATAGVARARALGAQWAAATAGDASTALPKFAAAIADAPTKTTLVFPTAKFIAGHAPAIALAVLILVALTFALDVVCTRSSAKSKGARSPVRGGGVPVSAAKTAGARYGASPVAAPDLGGAKGKEA